MLDFIEGHPRVEASDETVGIAPGSRENAGIVEGEILAALAGDFVLITASSSTYRTLPATFKLHRLPCGRLPSSRCIRSAHTKRMRTRTVARGRSRYSTKTCH